MEDKRELASLIIVNKELASNLFVTHNDQLFQNEEKQLLELILLNKNLSDELEIAHKELAFEHDEKEKRAAELVIANKELLFQNDEKENRASELVIANKELVVQHEQKEMRAAELIIANKELVFQSDEKAKRAAELIIANKELVFQSEQKAKRAAELIVANKELIAQNKEKEKRAEELVIANKELLFQNDEKGMRASELVIANKELVVQHEQKEKRAAELIIANKELIAQSKEKAKRAAELIITNNKLAFQEKLAIANKRLSNQYQENAKHSDELLTANIKFQKSLKLNTDKDFFISILAHDLRSPFNAQLHLSDLLLENIDVYDLIEIKEIVSVLNKSAQTTSKLLEDILMWANNQSGNIPFEPKKLSILGIGEQIAQFFRPMANEKNITIDCSAVEDLNVFADINMLKAVFRNLVSNAIKFTNIGGQIAIKTITDKTHTTITISDNGIGLKTYALRKLFDITEIFSTNGTANESGTGLGLVLCKQFIEQHNGEIWAVSEFGKGSQFNFTLPVPA